MDHHPSGRPFEPLLNTVRFVGPRSLVCCLGSAPRCPCAARRAVRRCACACVRGFVRVFRFSHPLFLGALFPRRGGWDAGGCRCRLLATGGTRPAPSARPSRPGAWSEAGRGGCRKQAAASGRAKGWASSSVGQSTRLISVGSEVQVLPGPCQPADWPADRPAWNRAGA